MVNRAPAVSPIRSLEHATAIGPRIKSRWRGRVYRHGNDNQSGYAITDRFPVVSAICALEDAAASPGIEGGRSRWVNGDGAHPRDKKPGVGRIPVVTPSG